MERLTYDVKIHMIRDGREVTIYARIKGDDELIEPGDLLWFDGLYYWWEATAHVGSKVHSWTQYPGHRVARAIEQPMIDVLYWEVLV